jgi:hypothetical protein
LGSLTFALNGKWLAHLAGGHVSLVGAIGWLPWAVLGVTMVLHQPAAGGKGGASLFSGWGWVLVAAVALAMQITTHTLLLIYTAYLLAAMVVWQLAATRAWRWDWGRWRKTAPLLLRLGAIPLVAGLLGAAQLLPLAELARFSNRSLSLSQAAEFSLSPAQLLVGLLLPAPHSGHELIIYLGLVPLLLAPFGLSRDNRWSWFYGGLVVLAALIALGPATPVHGLFYRFAPGFGWVRTPARVFFVGGLALAVLAGFGLDHVLYRSWSAAARRRLSRLAVGLGALALLTGLGLAFGFGQLNRAALALALVIPAGLSLILLRIRDQLPTRWTVILLGLLLFLDLASFGRSLIRLVPRAEALAPGRPAAEYLARQPGLFRVYSPSYSLPAQTAAAAGLHLADGVEPVHLALYDQFMARAGGYGDSSFSVTIPNFGGTPPESALQETEPDLQLLGLLNVEYLASSFPLDWPGLSPVTEVAGTYLYRNELARPRAWVAHQARPAGQDWLEQLAELPADGRRILVEDSSPENQPGGPGGPPSPARVTRYTADSIAVAAAIDRPGWLVLSEIWYPGWQATVNGELRPVTSVNGLLRGIYLSQPGTYEVALNYRPQSVYRGGWLSGLTGGLILVLGLASGRLRPRPANE